MRPKPLSKDRYAPIVPRPVLAAAIPGGLARPAPASNIAGESLHGVGIIKSNGAMGA
jgi:hypothetical protein